MDAAVFLGAGAQISAPHVHAKALDLVGEYVETALHGHQIYRVLDIGAGSGAMCTLLAHLLGGQGTVLSIEHIEELVSAARLNVAKHHANLLGPDGVLEIRCEDAVAMAQNTEYAELFDVIHCGAALQEVDAWLVGLLRPGGRAVVPLGPTDAPQWLCTVDKLHTGGITVARHIRVLYVPVTSAAAQRNRGDQWDQVVERCSRNSELLADREKAPHH